MPHLLQQLSAMDENDSAKVIDWIDAELREVTGECRFPDFDVGLTCLHVYVCPASEITEPWMPA